MSFIEVHQLIENFRAWVYDLLGFYNTFLCKYVLYYYRRDNWYHFKPWQRVFNNLCGIFSSLGGMIWFYCILRLLLVIVYFYWCIVSICFPFVLFSLVDILAVLCIVHFLWSWMDNGIEMCWRCYVILLYIDLDFIWCIWLVYTCYFTLIHFCCILLLFFSLVVCLLCCYSVGWIHLV